MRGVRLNEGVGPSQIEAFCAMRCTIALVVFSAATCFGEIPSLVAPHVALVAPPIPEHVGPLKALTVELLGRGLRVSLALPVPVSDHRINTVCNEVDEVMHGHGWTDDVPGLGFVTAGRFSGSVVVTPDNVTEELFGKMNRSLCSSKGTDTILPHPLSTVSLTTRSNKHAQHCSGGFYDRERWHGTGLSRYYPSELPSSSFSPVLFSGCFSASHSLAFFDDWLAFLSQFQEIMFAPLVEAWEGQEAGCAVNAPTASEGGHGSPKRKVGADETKLRVGGATPQQEINEPWQRRVSHGRPDLVVLDRYAFGGIDAATFLGLPVIVNSPHMLYGLGDIRSSRGAPVASTMYAPAPFTRLPPQAQLAVTTRGIVGHADAHATSRSCKINSTSMMCEAAVAAGSANRRGKEELEDHATVASVGRGEGVFARGQRWYDWVCFRLTVLRAMKRLGAIRTCHGVSKLRKLIRELLGLSRTTERSLCVSLAAVAEAVNPAALPRGKRQPGNHHVPISDERMVLVNTIFGVESPRPIPPLLRMVGPLLPRGPPTGRLLRCLSIDAGGACSPRSIPKSLEATIDTKYQGQLQKSSHVEAPFGPLCEESSLRKWLDYGGGGGHRSRRRRVPYNPQLRPVVVVDLGPYASARLTSVEARAVITALRSVGVRGLWMLPPSKWHVLPQALRWAAETAAAVQGPMNEDAKGCTYDFQADSSGATGVSGEKNFVEKEGVKNTSWIGVDILLYGRPDPGLAPSSLMSGLLSHGKVAAVMATGSWGTVQQVLWHATPLLLLSLPTFDQHDAAARLRALGAVVAVDLHATTCSGCYVGASIGIGGSRCCGAWHEGLHPRGSRSSALDYEIGESGAPKQRDECEVEKRKNAEAPEWATCIEEALRRVLIEPSMAAAVLRTSQALRIRAGNGDAAATIERALLLKALGFETGHHLG